jgi:hypothetical protein
VAGTGKLTTSHTTIRRGYVVFRLWDEHTGLCEAAWNFTSLDELFALCLQADSALLVDRIVIEGEDEHTTSQTLTLTFQSLSAVRHGDVTGSQGDTASPPLSRPLHGV